MKDIYYNVFVMGHHFTHARMAIIKKLDNKCWEGCGKIGTFITLLWECKMMKPLWQTVWQFLKNLNMVLPFDPTIPPLGIYLREMKTCHTKTCT